jgi:hypothetical protein
MEIGTTEAQRHREERREIKTQELTISSDFFSFLSVPLCLCASVVPICQDRAGKP